MPRSRESRYSPVLPVPQSGVSRRVGSWTRSARCASAGADLLSGLAVAPIPILIALDVLEIWHIVLLAVLGTLADAAGSTARQSLVPAAADAGGHLRERANALFTSAEHIGYLLGAPIAGLLIAAFDVAAALCVSAVLGWFAAVVVATFVRVPGQRAAETKANGGLRETITFISNDPALRALVVFPTAAVLLVGPLVPLVLPVLARESFGGPVVLGMMVASYGTGGLLGAALFGMVGSRLSRRGLYIGVFLVIPATFAAIAFGQLLPVTLAALLTLGAAAGSLVPLQATIRQERSPDRLLACVRWAEHREHPGRRADRGSGYRLADRRVRSAFDVGHDDRRGRTPRSRCRNERVDAPVRRPQAARRCWELTSAL